MYTDEELIAFNRRGLIPGPNQTETQFVAKVELLEGLESDRVKTTGAFESTLRLFDIEPDWLSLIHSRKGLSFWEGAVTWKDERPEGFCVPAIQIRDDLEQSFLGRYYPLDEMLAHETVHAVRCDFHEPVFEEILAYQTAGKSWRRWLGPLLQHPGETKGFLILLILAVVAQWLDLLLSCPFWVGLFVWLPWIALGCGVVRLWKNQAVFKRCLSKLEKVVGKSARAVALRLTDLEIRLFATCSEDEICTYIAKEKEVSLRWRMIALSSCCLGFDAKTSLN